MLTHSIQHEGLTRTALLYVPQHMWRRGALPLVLAFHGGGSSPEKIALNSAMHRIAEREGFVVAYPAGTQSRSGLTWVPGGRESARTTGDVRFVRSLIIDLQRHFEIDPSRIFATGFSLGGSLVYELACLLADRFAAVGVVSGTMTTPYCNPARPVSLIHIHGTKDRRVPLKGGRGPATSRNNEWPPVQDCIDRWRQVNDCTGEPDIVRLASEGVTGYRYFGAADVELWLVEGGYHSWPGGRRHGTQATGQPAPAGFSASERIWRFFAAHSRDHHPFATSLGGGQQGARPTLMTRGS